jgi:hypothetical protein
MRTLILLQVVHTCYIQFQGEYESPMVACSMVLEDNNECLCSWKCPNEDFRFEKEYIVIGDPLQQTRTCSSSALVGGSAFPK